MVSLIFTLCFMFQCCVQTPVVESPQNDDVNKAKAALALAKAKSDLPCATDIEKCRAESKRTGKPLILAVNVECKGLSSVFQGTAIFCKVKSYKEEGHVETEPRFVFISPDVKNGELFIRSTLSKPKPTLQEFKTELKKTTVVKSAIPLNWI